MSSRTLAGGLIRPWGRLSGVRIRPPWTDGAVRSRNCADIGHLLSAILQETVRRTNVVTAAPAPAGGSTAERRFDLEPILTADFQVAQLQAAQSKGGEREAA